MSTTALYETDVVDLEDVAEDLFAYQVEAVRRSVTAVEERPTPSALEYAPLPAEFVD